jgi:8-oxo-dGTP pyrophosphatase MutT (NUDIX family)
MADGRFQAMVGILIWREEDGKYLVLQRSPAKDWAAGEWECPSGRLMQGEGFVEAVGREALEETNLKVRIECLLGTAHFYRGTHVPGNEMVGVQFGCSVEDGTGFVMSEEHSEYRWITAEEARALFPIPHLMGRLIARAESFRALMPLELRQLHWDGDSEF